MVIRITEKKNCNTYLVILKEIECINRRDKANTKANTKVSSEKMSIYHLILSETVPLIRILSKFTQNLIFF